MKARLHRFLTASGAVVLMMVHLSVCYAALPSNIPFKPASETDDNLVFRAIGAFLIAAAVAYGIAWCIRRYLPQFGKKIGRKPEARQLERLESMRMSPRSSLIRVRWGNEELLLGENEGGVSLLGKRPLENKEAVIQPTALAEKSSHE